MANVTGTMPLLTGTFMQEMERRRQQQDLEQQRQRQQGELQMMFQQLYPNSGIPPQAITPTTAQPIMNTLGDRAQMQNQQQMLQMRQQQAQQEATAKAAEKAQKEAQKQAEQTAELEEGRNAFLSANPDFEKTHFPVTSKAALDYAKEIAKQEYEMTQFKQRQQWTWQNTPPKPESNKPQFLPSTATQEIEKMLGNKYLSFIPEAELTDDKDFTKPETVYYYLPMDKKHEWDSEKSMMVRNAMTGGTMGIYGGQPNAMPAPTNIMPPGAVLQPNMRTKEGKQVYQLPNGQYWTPE